MKAKILIICAGLAAIAAACNSKPVDQTTAITPPPPPIVQEQKLEVQMADTGFTPAKLSVKKGAKITFINTGLKAHWPAAGLHSSHDLVYDSKKKINPGESFEFTMDKIGEYRFHDHFNDDFVTEVEVTE